MTDIPDDRLESWKEIAAYLRRDVTTVQRWEKKEGLPVHRHVHARLGSVHAFKSELDAWRQRHSDLRVDESKHKKSDGALNGSTESLPVYEVSGSHAPFWITTVLFVMTTAALVGGAWWFWFQRDSPTADAAVPALVETRAEAYEVDVSLHRLQSELEALTPGSRVSPGDELYLSFEASRDVFVYIVNEDNRGDAYLLFPVPASELSNPVVANQRHRLPGSRDGRQIFWQVTSAGGEERFYVLVSPARLENFERILASIPEARVGTQVSLPITAEAIGTMRGIGGIT